MKDHKDAWSLDSSALRDFPLIDLYHFLPQHMRSLPKHDTVETDNGVPIPFLVVRVDNHGVFHFQQQPGWFNNWKQQQLKVTPKNFPSLSSSTGSCTLPKPARAILASSAGLTATTITILSAQNSSASVSQISKTTALGVKRDSKGALKPSTTPLLNYLKNI